jgi:hypothetical protein
LRSIWLNASRHERVRKKVFWKRGEGVLKDELERNEGRFDRSRFSSPRDEFQKENRDGSGGDGAREKGAERYLEMKRFCGKRRRDEKRKEERKRKTRLANHSEGTFPLWKMSPRD